MILRRIIDILRQQNWTALALEFVIVFVEVGEGALKYVVGLPIEWKRFLPLGRGR